MGSLKDEMRGLREDRAPFEKMAEDGELPGGSDGSTVPVPEAPHMDTSEDITPGDYQPQLHTNAIYIEDSDKDPPSKDEVPSGRAADNADRSDSTEVKHSKQTDAIPPTEQPTTATDDDDTTTSTEFLRGGGGGGEVQEKAIAGHDDGVKQAEIVNISVPVPSTPGPFSPLSPAPIGQHHMRTQVSLEVVQCCSAATSPMTPPQGGQAFTFPSSSLGQCGASLGSDTKDAGLQVGLRTECCSVATSPMTPKTPSATAFPELVGGEIFLVTKSPAEVASDKSGALKCTASSISTESCPSTGLNVSPVTLEDIRPNQQGKQQRMGSMDQDITILVTLHGNSEEEEEKAESSPCPTGPEMVQIECDEIKTNTRDAKKKDGKEMIFTQTVAPANAQETSGTTPQTNTSDESSISADKDDTGEDLRIISVTKPPSIPQSPAPFGCHNMRTQVSLEVVHCQSVATSPMTPPQGDQAFCFPSSSLGQCGATETKDAQMQAGEQVEFRSVATAPMTPRTPTATTFPEVREEASRGEREEKISEEEGKKKVQLVEDKEEVVEEKEENVSGEKESEAAGEDREEGGSGVEKGEEEEEPLQEVSWDEKGMTWEVYGAVVEVTVLGSAIQKHLEKQVEKQKKPSMPPPPPLSLLATPPASEGGSSSDKGSGQGKGLGLGKGRAGRRGEQNEEASRRRRNPFRLLMENMQQPHCCSRAHSAE